MGGFVFMCKNKISLKPIILFVILSLVTFGLMGFSIPSYSSEFESLLQNYLDSNASSFASQKQLEVAKSDLYKHWFPQEPSFTWSQLDDHASESYSLSIPLSFPTKVWAMSSIDQAKYFQVDSEQKAKNFELIQNFINSYQDCSLSQSSLKISLESLEDMKVLSESLKQLYESGHSTQAERIGAELQFRSLESDQAAAQEKARSSCQKLKSLVYDRRFKSPLEVEKTSQAKEQNQENLNNEIDFSKLTLLEDLPTQILDVMGSKTPDELRAEASLKLSEKIKSRLAWTYWPDLNIGISQNHYLSPVLSPSSSEWTKTFTVGITLPIFFFANERVEYKRAMAQTYSDQYQSRLQQLNSEVDRQSSVKEFRRLRLRLNEIQQRDLALAQSLVDSTMSAYRLGKLGFSELMNSRKTLFDLKTQELQLKTQLVQARLKCLSQCE